MANLKEIKKRVGSLKNTSQITKAMKMVSAAKLRRAQDGIVGARPYADKMRELLIRLSSNEEPISHPLLEVRSADKIEDDSNGEVAKKVQVVLITSDRGLCGGFNANMTKKAESFLKECADNKNVTLSFVGSKGADYFKRNNANINKIYELPKKAADYSFASQIANDLIEAFTNGECDEVFFIYSNFKSALTQVPVVDRLLPIIPDQDEEQEESPDLLYEPSSEEILKTLLPRYICSQVYRALLETAASEHGSRMTAMDSASKNAGEMIDRLNLVYNRARQASITTELMDIINGAESV